jgi:beta,beta-carotene 9',10'-dioxygenase
MDSASATAPAAHRTTASSAAPPYAKGLESLESETRIDRLPVTGELPSWLNGSLLRTGPAKWEVGEQRMRHWFDGFAMLHRFGIADGNVSYANRFVQSKAYRAATETGKITYSEFATDPCRSLFSRVVSVFKPKLTDNPNINLVQLGERFISMTEAPIAIEFDPETLETAGVAYEPPGTLTTAHPHTDRADGGMVNYAAKLGPRSSYRFFHLAPDATQPRVIASVPVSEPAYVHSFGLTERWILLAEFPLVVNPITIPLSGRPYIENYRWKPELGTRLTLVDRATGEARGPFETDPFFCFHHINAYEENGSVVADLCTYPDAQLIEDLYLDRLRAGKPVTPPETRRLRIDLASGGKVTNEQLTDIGFELPRINYGRCNERPYRYAWGTAPSRSGWLIDRIVRADLEDGSTQSWSLPDHYPGEPVFVPRPGAEAEDDGVLLSIVLDANKGTSSLLVLDAHDLSELAHADVPHHIPFGFHGQFAEA